MSVIVANSSSNPVPVTFSTTATMPVVSLPPFTDRASIIAVSGYVHFAIGTTIQQFAVNVGNPQGYGTRALIQLTVSMQNVTGSGNTACAVAFLTTKTPSLLAPNVTTSSQYGDVQLVVSLLPPDIAYCSTPVGFVTPNIQAPSVLTASAPLSVVTQNGLAQLVFYTFGSPSTNVSFSFAYTITELTD